MSVALIFATWRGPVPCIHIHSNDVDAVTAGLAEHVRSRHEDELGEDHARWHIHLMLPQDVGHTENSPTSPDRPEDPLLAQTTLVQLSDSATSVSLLLDWSRYVGVPLNAHVASGSRLHFSADSPSADPSNLFDASFLTTMLRAAPLCAVTGVALR